MTSVKRRSYRSTIRRGDAPQLVVAAARHLFATKGYLATSIDDIAAEAGVARPTVFTAVGSKPAILKAVVDQAIVGDDAAVPVAGRPWYAQALEEPDPLRALHLHVRNMCRIQQRAGAVRRALETAAAVDPAAAELYAEVRSQHRAGVAEMAADIAAKAGPQCDGPALAALMFVLPAQSYYRLVDEEGWPVEKFEQWLVDVLERVCGLSPRTG